MQAISRNREEVRLIICTIEQLNERIAPVATRYRLKAVYAIGTDFLGTEGAQVRIVVDETGTALEHDMVALCDMYGELCAALGTWVNMLTERVLEQTCANGQRPWLKELVDREKTKIY